MRIILTTLLISSLFGCSSHTKSTFIPSSPLTHDEVEAEKDLIRNDPEWSDIDVDEYLGDGKGMFTYRDSDIRSALTGIENSDIRLSLCSNSMMSGATSVVFSSKTDEPNRIKLKSASCSPVEGGLECGKVDYDLKYQYKNIYFNSGMLDYDKAVEIIKLFEFSGIEDLPRWHSKMFSVDSVTSVERTLNGYLIGVGNVYCGGCVAKLLVKPVLDDQSNIKKLSFVDSIGGICI